MSHSIYKLAYLSYAKSPLGEDELLQLLDKSRANNVARGITGLLLYCDGNFLQMLEGERIAVDSLYRKICEDPRHTGIIHLFSETTDTRDFPEWSMGFRRFERNHPDNPVPEGFNLLMERQEIPPAEIENLSRKVQVFIKTFRSTAGL